MNKIWFIIFFIIAEYLFSADNNESLYNKGLQYYTEKKFLLAIGSFKKAADAGMQDPLLFFYLGNCYTANEDYEKALEQYKLALELKDDFLFQGLVHFNLGYVYFQEKEYKKSIDYFNKAYGFDTNLSQVYWLKGNAYYKLQDKDNTISEWEKYLIQAPNGKESDNIRKALNILKSVKFAFAPENTNVLVLGGTNAGGAGGTAGGTNMNVGDLNIDQLIDVEGVLEDVKIPNKSTIVNEDLPDIEQ